jgi:hypothetical protein
MSEVSSSPVFEARPLKSASGWYVRVVWPNGKRDHIAGIVTQKEAQRWIEGNASAWLSEHSTVASAFGRLATT